MDSHIMNPAVQCRALTDDDGEVKTKWRF